MFYLKTVPWFLIKTNAFDSSVVDKCFSTLKGDAENYFFNLIDFVIKVLSYGLSAIRDICESLYFRGALIC